MKHLYRPPRKFGPEDLGLYYNYSAKAYAGSPLAPAGYHIASAADWQNLYEYYGGQSYAAGAFKEVNPFYWINPNTGATNASGISMRGAGFRNYSDGKFVQVGYSAWFWNGAPVVSTYSIAVNVDGVNVGGTTNTKYGFSIICVKNDSTNDGSFTDYDGNVYPTVLVNGLVWATRYLRVLHYNDGTAIPIAYTSTQWLAASGACVSAWNDKW